MIENCKQLLNDEEIFLNRNRIHCTKYKSFWKWHRDGVPTGDAKEIDIFEKV